LRKGSETGGEHNGSESGQGPRALLRAAARSPAGTFPALRIQFSGNHKLSQKNSARTTVKIISPPPPEDHRRPARWHTLCEGPFISSKGMLYEVRSRSGGCRKEPPRILLQPAPRQHH